MTKRIDRVNELIKQEFGIILEEYFNLENTIISISRVKTAPDLKTARVFVTIYPFKKSEEAMNGLRIILSRLQLILSQTIELKYTPKLEIILDESLEYEDKIESLLKKIKDDNIKR